MEAPSSSIALVFSRRKKWFLGMALGLFIVFTGWMIAVSVPKYRYQAFVYPGFYYAGTAKVLLQTPKIFNENLRANVLPHFYDEGFEESLLGHHLMIVPFSHFDVLQIVSSAPQFAQEQPQLTKLSMRVAQVQDPLILEQRRLLTLDLAHLQQQLMLLQQSEQPLLQSARQTEQGVGEQNVLLLAGLQSQILTLQNSIYATDRALKTLTPVEVSKIWIRSPEPVNLPLVIKIIIMLMMSLLFSFLLTILVDCLLPNPKV